MAKNGKLVKGETIKVLEVTHRNRDAQGRRFGHIGYIKRRTPTEMAKYGGGRFAAWARLTKDGIEVSAPQRFETYDTEAEARLHAKYAAATARRLLA